MSLMCNDIEYKAEQDTSNKLNQLFVRIGRDISNSIHSTDEMPRNIQSILNSTLFRRVSPKHIESIISKLNDKSCHISSYPTKAFKCVRHIISPVLSRLVNKSLKLGSFPNSLKTARVIPLFKFGTTTSLTIYRPISTLLLLNKVFERLVCIQLYFFL